MVYVPSYQFKKLIDNVKNIKINRAQQEIQKKFLENLDLLAIRSKVLIIPK